MRRSRLSDARNSRSGWPVPPASVSTGLLIILGGLLLGCFFWAGVSGVQQLSVGGDAAAKWAGILFAVCWTALTAVVIAGTAIQLSTELSEHFVTQLSLGGRVEIKWADVKIVQHDSPAIIRISDGQQTINLAVWIYRDADALSTWIEARLPERGDSVMEKWEPAGTTDPDVENRF